MRPRIAKRVLDVSLSAVALVLSVPIQAVIALLIWARMGTPVLFRQERAGLGGAPFTMIKFRTMLPAPPGASAGFDDANRLTRLGAALRASSLDELPTLFNVLKGDMSIVGPRPLPTEYSVQYTPDQRRREEVLPGITGLTQVCGRNTLSWAERFDLDARYVDSQTLRLDLSILVKTVGVLFRREGPAYGGGVTSAPFEGERP